MFRKILIANRGEIACRILRTAKRMGIATVAVYSHADRDALHVGMADESVEIGPAPAQQSYLSIERMIAACRASGADAVHPGYGFLSERADFAAALERVGIAFIGPNAAAIAAMGDKIESKRRAMEAGISTVPGFAGGVENAAHAAHIANEIGFPVMIKASAGGGGKGMRIALSRSEIEEGFRLARSEAGSSFGDDRVFIEKYIVDPRHIEIQILADKHGHIIHLGERECSIQRRNQKIIEEAPSPFLDNETRETMGAQAIALAKAVGYDSAGTVEFVVGQDRVFYFLEMNTRLQVEHPVTEMVTGLDLVEQMIRVAAGEPLALGQADVKCDGWAIEARIYAEDPTRNFLPSVGRLKSYEPPCEASGRGVTLRNETGVAEGSEISIHYDPLIAKLCAHAPTRSEATQALGRALDGFVIEGISHTAAFASAVLSRPRWREGRLSTNFIAQEFTSGFPSHGIEISDAKRLVAVAAAIDWVCASRRRRISGQMRTDLAAAPERHRVAMLENHMFRIEVDETHDAIQVTMLDAEARPEHPRTLCSNWRPGLAVWHGVIDGERIAVQVRSHGNGTQLCHAGKSAMVRILSPRHAELSLLMPKKAIANNRNALLCPMPGVVKSIEVAEGQNIKTGETLCVVEAMKMENVLRAEHDATIRAICVKPGAILSVDAVIMEFG